MPDTRLLTRGVPSSKKTLEAISAKLSPTDTYIARWLAEVKAMVK